MLPVLSLIVDSVPREIPYKHGITLETLATNWVPRGLMPAKPETADIQVYRVLFPAQGQITNAGTAPSMFGGFFVDSGLVGVVLGSFVVGFLLRFAYESFAKAAHRRSAQLLFAAFLPLVAVLLRGNPTDTLARAEFVLVPLFAFAWWTSRRRRV